MSAPKRDERRPIEPVLRARIAELEAQVAGLEQMNTEKAAEIRRLRMGNHPAGRALRADNAYEYVTALAEALTERDAEHEGGGPARALARAWDEGAAAPRMIDGSEEPAVDNPYLRGGT